MTTQLHRPEANLGLISVTGTDARRFLHAQTTRDLLDPAAAAGTTAAWLSAKGRVRAIFDIVPHDSGLWLVLEAERIDWLIRELRKFVLRADVVLAADTDNADAVIARLPDATGLAAVRAGRAAVPEALAERYTAHMLNLDLLGAVSFTKGCYPGQEIVARTEHLGEVKRRLRRFSTGPGTRPAAGDAVIEPGGDPIGEVNRAAATDDGYELLAVVTLERANQPLTLIDGRELRPLPLPYPD